MTHANRITLKGDRLNVPLVVKAIKEKLHRCHIDHSVVGRTVYFNYDTLVVARLIGDCR